MPRCDRSDHDHYSLETARMCAAIQNMEDNPSLWRCSSDFIVGFLHAVETMKERLAEMEAGARLAAAR